MKRPMTILVGTAALLSVMMTSNVCRGDGTGVAARRFHVDLQLFSLIPEVGIDSYRGYGSGSAGGPEATVGHSVNDERQFSLEVHSTVSSQSFMVTVHVQPGKGDTLTQEMKRTFDLTNLQPQSIEIVRNDDGRVYQVQLKPRIEEVPEPRRFNVDDMRLDHWSFQNSAVILNDQDYVGRLGMSSGQLAAIDLPGLAQIEFSLVPFRNAVPQGTLEDGVITITHDDGTSLRISDVTNGTDREQLRGPYQVFVRWSKSTLTVDEYQNQLAETIAEVRKRIEQGDLPASENWLQRLERAQDSGRPMMMSGSLGPISRRDRMDAK